MNEVTNIGQLSMCHLDMEKQVLKLSAWVQTIGFILEGLDTEGMKACKVEANAVSFANHYPAYSEMLFLALSGLMDCKDALEKLCQKETELINVEK